MGAACNCFSSETDDAPSRSPLVTSRGPRYDEVPKYEAVQEVEGAPIGKKWYHGGIGDREAEFRLSSVAEGNGNFLVYDSTKVRGEYNLLVFFDGKCHRWKIARRRDASYIIGTDGPGVKSYESVKALIKHHRGLRAKPLKLEYGGTVKLTNYAFVPENTGNSRWRGN